MRFLFYTIISSLGLFVSNTSTSQISFSDVSQSLGLADTTKSFGLFWGDIDNNGFADLFSSAHYNIFNPINPSTQLKPRILLNQNGNSYSIVEPELYGRKDFHGAVFFKFEDDDFYDLFVMTGSTSEDLLYRSPSLDFSMPDTTCGPCSSWGRGMNPGFLDYNYDGKLDLVLHHKPARDFYPHHLETLVFEQGPDFHFNSDYSHLLPDSERGMVADVDSNGELEYITIGTSGLRVYDFDAGGFNLLYERAGFIGDSDIGDYDNDGSFEFIMGRWGMFEAVRQISDGQIEIFLRDFPQTKEVIFSASGAIELFVRPSDFNLVFSSGQDQIEKDEFIPLTINSTDPDYQGWSEGPFDESHVHIGYDAVSNTWKLTCNGTSNDQLRISLSADQLLNLIDTIGVSPENTDEFPITLNSFVNSGGALTLQEEAIIDMDHISSISSADFDNDGDLDLVMSMNNVLVKEPYHIYLNDGNANFTLATDLLDDLEGLDIGHADVVTVGDYNVDGKIDIVAINGGVREVGTIEVFKNTSAPNNWIEFELQGVQSNRMAIGAIVSIYYGDMLQRMIVDGGFHNKAQDEHRIHFGLGTLTSIDSVVVEWPSGIVTTLTDLLANIRHVVSESSPNDLDGDGIQNELDNCPEYYNPEEQDVVYQDLDGDGFTTCEYDCDDANDAIYPGSPEVCDGYDNDCDGGIDNGCVGCEVFERSPINLVNSLNAVSGVVDRIQVRWFKSPPFIEYSNEDAAACDIKYWSNKNLDPITGEPVGPNINSPDTLNLIDTKIFLSDGVSPGSIFKWPIFFRAEGSNNTKRVEPNTRYEWKVRCACEHGAGIESPWSLVRTFNTPNFDPITGILDPHTDCQVFETAPVDLTKSFDLVNGIQDRLQVKWFKDSPQVKYSDEDAAACDIKFWPKRDLIPGTTTPTGDPIIAAPGDTTEIVDTKKFQPDGITPREIFKWPVKFRADGVDNNKRAEPNIRYEWKVRCSCEHGAGQESPWSVVKIFNTPDFDPSTGILNIGTNKSHSLEVQKVEVYPNPSDGSVIYLKWDSETTEQVKIEIRDLSAKLIYASEIRRADPNLTIISFENESLETGMYIINLIQDNEVIQSRFVVK